MSNEYYAAVKQLIKRSLEAAKSGRYGYVCFQYTDDKGTDVYFTFRSDKGEIKTEIEEAKAKLDEDSLS